MWAVAKTILKDSSTSQTRIALMNLILLHNPQFERDSEDIRFMKETIQGLISSPDTRNEGYLLLDAVTKSNPSIYINNWGPIITSSLKSPDNCVSKNLTLRILKRLVVNFSGSPILHEAFQRFIPEIVSLLLKTAKSDEEATNSCKALAVCMQHLPAIVGPFSDEIESFLMEHVGSIDFKAEEGIADCFAAIPICLESRLKPKPSYSEVWLDAFLKLLNTLQALLNDFLKNSKADDSCVDVEGLPLLPTPCEDEEKDEYTYIFKRIKIFSSICKGLSKMISVHTDSNSDNIRVQVPVQDLLKCLERIFLVYDHIKGNRSTENSLINLTYPVMQISALSVLESLIINFTIIEQSGNLVTILNKIILTTVSETTESWAWYVRSSSWKVADAWLKYYGSKSSKDIVNNKFLITELLKDITPDQGSGLSQAARMEKFGSGDMREECCKEALNVLSSMFIFGGAFMDKDFINDICCTVLKVSCKVQQSSHPAKKFVYPYTNHECRLNLYQCLLQASLSDPMQTKFVRQAINIFRFATKDPYLKVRTNSSAALNVFRFYINPKKPLPETLTLGAARVHPPEEESVQSGLESGFNWNAQNDSSQEERSMDVSPPCQIETVYHNSLGSDSRRDLHPDQPSPPAHYADGLETQCNGSSQLAPKQPSHSNVDSESDDVKEYSVEEAEMVDDAPEPVHAPIIETLKPESRPHLVELKPAQVALPDEGTNHRENAAGAQNFPEAEEVEDVSPQRMAENGVYAESEDEENSDEEDEEGSDEEEENNEGYAPQYSVSRYSPVSEENERSGLAEEYYPEKKRQRMNNEEEQSSGEEYEEAPPTKLHNQEMAQESEELHHPTVHMVASSSSPTVAEMCQDFVLAEPEEIR